MKADKRRVKAQARSQLRKARFRENKKLAGRLAAEVKALNARLARQNETQPGDR